jgi:PAS domain S-box-containing protein
LNIPDLLNLPDWIVNSKIIAVAMTDMKGDYIYVNRHFHERFFWLSDNLIGQPYYLTIHPDDVEMCNETVQECIMAPGRFISVELRKPIGGSENYEWTKWEFSLFQGSNNEPIGILCTGHDITDTKKLLLEVAKKNEVIFKMTYAQSHDIRGPVASMKGLIELMVNEKDTDSLMQYCSWLKELLDKLDNAIAQIVNIENGS